MNTYEGMIIFPDRMQDEEIEETLKLMRAEIEKCGGDIYSSTRIGRRLFARPIKKDEYGHYAVVTFDGDAEICAKLQVRFKLDDNVTRIQFVRTTIKPASAVTAAASEGSSDG